MARKNSVRTKLPPEVLKELDKRLLAGNFTLDELLAFIRGELKSQEDAPSRSSLGRYAKDFEATVAALRESREMARGIAQELGPESVEGEQGRLLVDMLRSFAFTYMKKVTANPEAEFDPADFSKLARSVRDLSQAMQSEQDFAKRIKEDAKKELEAKVKEKIAKLGTAEELKSLTDEELERKIAELAT